MQQLSPLAGHAMTLLATRAVSRFLVGGPFCSCAARRETARKEWGTGCEMGWRCYAARCLSGDERTSASTRCTRLSEDLVGLHGHLLHGGSVPEEQQARPAGGRSSQQCLDPPVGHCTRGKQRLCWPEGAHRWGSGGGPSATTGVGAHARPGPPPPVLQRGHWAASSLSIAALRI